MSEIVLFSTDSGSIEWMKDRACTELGADEFFVKPGHTVSQDTKDTCRGCPVREDCFLFSKRTDKAAGCWGGMSSSERDEMTEEEGLGFIREDTRKFLEDKQGQLEGSFI